MKNIFAFLICIIISHTGFAQKPDPLLARVRYTYINNKDTLSNKNTRKENMILFLGKNASLYASYDKIRAGISDDQKFRNMMQSNTSGKPVAVKVDLSNSEWLTSTTYLYFNKEAKFFTKEVIAFQNYLIEDEVPNIKWTLTKDTANFSGLSCKKATTSFEGRKWIAWYAPSLPFQSGPWKLINLPGLVVEAYDENKTEHFEFAGFENAKDGDFNRTEDITKGPGAIAGTYNPVDQLIGTDVGAAYFESIIKLPFNAIKAERKPFDKFKAAYKKNPKGFNKAQFGF